MSNQSVCVEGHRDCQGPLAPINSQVCNACAEVYEQMVREGKAILLQFPTPDPDDSIPEPDDDGDYLDRKYSR
jgi:hypothetical protein